MTYINISNHTESHLTASTLSSMIDKTKSVGGSYFAITENGSLVSALKAYHACKENSIKPILGIELYFKDDNCDIINGSPLEQAKYFKLLMYFKDQDSYQEMVKMMSDSKRKKVTVGDGFDFPLFTWSDLDRLSKFNVVISTSNIEDMVSKHLLFNRADLSKKYYDKLVSLFGDRYTPAICVFKHEMYQERFVEVTLFGDKKIKLPYDTRVETDSKGFKTKAIDLFKFRNRHKLLHVIYYNGIKSKIKSANKVITNVKIIKDFIPFEQGDIQKIANRIMMALHKDRPLLINTSAYYSNKDEKIVQNMKLGEDGRFFHQDLYIKTPEEVSDYLKDVMGFNEDKIQSTFNYTVDWARQFDSFELKYDIKLINYGPEPEKILLDAINKRGRMKWDDHRYTEQLKREIDLLVNNGVVNLCPYFLPLIEISDYYNKLNKLVGPGRGSAPGFLISYLTGITQIDPIKWGLSSERFLTLDRVQEHNLPDIDWDSSDREPLEGKGGYFEAKYGDKYAKISTRGLLRVKSAMLDANRFLYGEVQSEIQKLSKSLPNTPQGISDYEFLFGYESNGDHVDGLFEVNEDLKKYAEERPEEWDIVKKAVSLIRQNSVHACARVLCSEPIYNIVPVSNGVTQFEAKECEKAGLIKYDFLVVSALGDIERCLKSINNKNEHKNLEIGYFFQGGQKRYIWDLPEDPEVFRMLNNEETETIFQFNTTTATPYLKKLKAESILDLTATTALRRPGPMDFIDEATGRDMSEEFIERRFGRSRGDIAILDKLLPETKGIITFQEQISKIAKDIGKMSVSDAENVRIAMGKKKIKLMDSLRPKFIEGARTVVDEATANRIWDMMATFGRYGFNKSHALSYSMIGYACAFLKYHYPLEWWAAVLTNAGSKEINEVFYKYVKDILLPPDINLSTDVVSVDYEKKTLRQKLSAITGLGDKVVENIVSLRPFKDMKDFVEKKPCGPSMIKKLIYIGAMDSLISEENKTVLQKLKHYEDMVKLVDFENKIKDLGEKGDLDKLEKLKKKGPSASKIDPYYIGVPPLKDYLIKKEICPTMNLDLYDLIKKHSTKVKVVERGGHSFVVDSRGRDMYLGGALVLEKMDNTVVDDRDIFFCIPAFVIDSKEFPYANNTRKALKMILDSSGYVSEKVLWPDYDSGQLTYPKELGKGCLVFVFYKKRVGKEGVQIIDIIVEVESEK